MLKNKKLIFILISIITLIIALSFFLFQNGRNITQQIPTTLITSVHKDLPLKFESDQTNIILQPGEVQTINYSVENLGNKSVSGFEISIIIF